jgi:RNA polymerase sigma-70 factor (ECF subfamily)
MALVAEQRAELLAAVNRLRPEERLAVSARYFLQLTEEETAAVMGCARGTVKSRLSRALRRLRSMLTPDPISTTEVSGG